MFKRLRIVFLILILFYLIIIIRLYFWQVTSYDKLKSLAEMQTINTFSNPAKRGNIYTRDKSQLVINQRAYQIYAEPQKIIDTKKIIDILASTLDISESSVSSKLKNNSLSWVSIAERIEEEKVEKLKEKSLEGIGYIEQSKRYYPEASMAAHILGFVGKNSKGEDQGYFGIEGFYDKQLKGRDGYIKRETDVLGNPILSGKYEEIPAENGRELYLTIDRSIQYIAEKKLQDGIEKYGAKGGNIIIIEPFSGAILAMTSYPSYDPNKYNIYPNYIYKNPSISTSFEPGSTFKTLVIAAALNERKIAPDTKYQESGSIEIGGYSIKTWNQKYHGEIDISQILVYSSNVGMVFVGKKLGPDNFLRYIDDLGFGKLTNIDLQEEFSPDIRDKNKWYEIDYATASFGQGIAVTPLQMVRAVSAIANGGDLVVPYIVDKIVSLNGKENIIKPQKIKRVFKKETTSMVTEMMVSAIDNGETKFIKPVGYRIAGKTGTAQIPIEGHYDSEKTIASFIGFAPVDNPKFVMLVTLTEPTSSPWGSETAAPIFFQIAKEIFAYYGISPSN